jgi:DNA-binding PucR family transcriptional regulator
VLTHQQSLLPDRGAEANPQFIEEARQAVRDCLQCGVMAIEQGGEWAGPIPPIVPVHVRHASAIGVQLSSHLQRYVAGYKIAWDVVLEEVVNSALSEPMKEALLRQASTAYVSLLSRLVAEAADAHAGELKRAAQTRNQRRGELVRKLLAGQLIARAELAGFHYDFDAEHLGVIATGAGAEQAMEVLAERLGGRLLAVSQEDSRVWAWLGGRASVVPAETEIARLLPGGPFAGVTLAVGHPAPRITGFRLTHRFAQAALLVAQRKPKRVTCYADVALEAHALQDDLLASSLLSTYVAPLESDRFGAKLFETLGAFYAARRNVASAASMLGVGRHTVERRLLRVERVIHRELDHCHPELELALRLAEGSDGAPSGTWVGPRDVSWDRGGRIIVSGDGLGLDDATSEQVARR